jgi:hypothetical protein
MSTKDWSQNVWNRFLSSVDCVYYGLKYYMNWENKKKSKEEVLKSIWTTIPIRWLSCQQNRNRAFADNVRCSAAQE